MFILNLVFTSMMFFCASSVKALDIQISPEVIKTVNVKRSILTDEGPVVYPAPGLRFAFKLSKIDKDYKIKQVSLDIKYVFQGIEKTHNIILHPKINIIQLDTNGFTANLKPESAWPPLMKGKILEIPSEGLLIQVGGLIPESERDLSWSGVSEVKSIQLNLNLESILDSDKKQKSIYKKLIL